MKYHLIAIPASIYLFKVSDRNTKKPQILNITLGFLLSTLNKWMPAGSCHFHIQTHPNTLSKLFLDETKHICRVSYIYFLPQKFFMIKWTLGFFILMWRYGVPNHSKYWAYIIINKFWLILTLYSGNKRHI